MELRLAVNNLSKACLIKYNFDSDAVHQDYHCRRNNGGKKYTHSLCIKHAHDNCVRP